MNENFYHCNTVDDMLAMARMPLSVIPTVAGAVRNVHLPLNADDKAWLERPEVHVFRAVERAKNISYRNISGPTFTPDDPLIVTGVSVMLYPEPMSCVVEGNLTNDKTELASPLVPLNRENMAHLEFGGPTWRFMWAFMHAYQLQFNCPQTSFNQIISERLIDIGNASSRMELSGLSNAMTSHLKIVRAYNRLAEAERLPYFLPINCGEVETDQSGEPTYTPYRTPPVPAAYGQPNGLPAIETWHRLPFPMPLDHNTKISLFLRPSAGDEDYLARMLEEGEIVSDYGAGARSAGVNQIPFGLIRVGLGLKGFQVREGVCHAWRRSLSSGKTLSQMLMEDGAVDAYNANYESCVTGVSGPSDHAAKIIDQYASELASTEG